MQQQSAVDSVAEHDLQPGFSDIQLKEDGSFILTLNGCPFHATETETPDIHAQVRRALEGGAASTPYVEPVPSSEDNQQHERVWRDQQIISVSWLRDRHRDELELDRETSMTQVQYAELLGYLQQLRDWPQSLEFPAPSSRPITPQWIPGQVH